MQPNPLRARFASPRARATHGVSGSRRPLAAALALAAALGTVGAAAPARAEVFFGDLHAHSEISDDATNPPDAFFLVARDLAGLDFVVLSDHDIFMTADEWEILKTTAASFNDEGRFIAFSGVEWTQDLGHHLNVYFRGDAEEYCPLRECRLTSDFHDFYGPRVLAGEAAAHVNHPVDPFFDIPWEQMDDAITTSVEVWNSASAGSQEHQFGGAIWALRAGFRLGLIGVSDDHGTDRRPPLIGTGLTGCHAAALTRDDLLAAMRARRCYATDGERIQLDLSLDGVPMGGEVEARIGERLTARVEVFATATPVAVEIVRNGDVVAVRRCDTPICDLEVPVSVLDPNTFVYARVTQAGDKHAWSSPVWVRGTCARGTSCLRSRLVDGGGDGDRDCTARWLLQASGTRISRSTPARVACRDADPACDADAEAGFCTFRLGLCFALANPSSGSCASDGVDGGEVLEPEAPPGSGDPTLLENRKTLEALFRAATTGEDGPSCTPLSHFRVPVGERRLEIRSSSAGSDDTDAIVLACEPPRGPARRPLPLLRTSAIP